jgi:death-on-curing protein
MIRYLKAEEILLLHALIIDQTGGTHGIRDVNLLASIAERPQATYEGKDLHAELFTKASVLCEALVNYHVFVDGNKRTAFITLGRFMVLNGYAVEATNAEVEDTMIAVAEKKLDVEKLSEWIEKHSRRILADGAIR